MNFEELISNVKDMSRAIYSIDYKSNEDDKDNGNNGEIEYYDDLSVEEIFKNCIKFDYSRTIRSMDNLFYIKISSKCIVKFESDLKIDKKNIDDLKSEEINRLLSPLFQEISLLSSIIIKQIFNIALITVPMYSPKEK